MRNFLQIKKRVWTDEWRSHKQSQWLDRNINLLTQNLIIFFIEGPWQEGGREEISGGLTSIDSIYSISKKLEAVHQSQVVLCTLAGKNLFRFSTFKSGSVIISLSLLKQFSKLKNVMIHIPEYLTGKLLYECQNGLLELNIKTPRLHINILNQNIQLMPPVETVESLKTFANKVTQTTAHKKYCSADFLDKYAIPYHLLGVRLSTEQYVKTRYQSKRRLILFSPDNPIINEEIKQILQQNLVDFEFQTIENITFEEYKSLVTRAMFCFTFGEGLDGYFIESFFSNTICFAIYNRQFFTDEYASLPTVIKDVDILKGSVVTLINDLNKPKAYDEIIAITSQTLEKDYSYNSYLENIQRFYKAYYN